MPKETRAYKLLHKAWPAAHFQRIETWAGAGIFDVNACHDGREIWIELKNGTLQKKSKLVKARVRKAQIVWQNLRESRGGETYVAIMVGKELFIIYGAWIRDLEKGIHVDKLKQINIPINELFYR